MDGRCYDLGTTPHRIESPSSAKIPLYSSLLHSLRYRMVMLFHGTCIVVEDCKFIANTYRVNFQCITRFVFTQKNLHLKSPIPACGFAFAHLTTLSSPSTPLDSLRELHSGQRLMNISTIGQVIPAIPILRASNNTEDEDPWARWA